MSVNCTKCGRFTSEDDTDDEHNFCKRCWHGRLHRYGPEWWEIRRAALQRDSYRCTDCGMSNAESREHYGEALSVHHIEPYDEGGSHDLDNLRTLCKGCHARQHGPP